MSALTVVAAAQSTNVPPRTKIDVTDSGSPSITSVTVIRTDASGRTATVRTSDGNPLTLTTSGSNRVGILYDYEMPYGVPVTYSTSEQPSSKSNMVTVVQARIWLVHPGIPARSMPIEVAASGDRSRTVNRGVFQPLGRSNAVVITDGRRKSPTGELTIRTRSDVDRTGLDALLDDAAVLLLNVPANLGWGIDTTYISIGDSTESRPVRYGPYPMREWRLPYVIVDGPVGGSQAAYAWANVVARFGSWNDVVAANSSWAAVQAPTG